MSKRLVAWKKIGAKRRERKILESFDLGTKANFQKLRGNRSRSSRSRRSFENEVTFWE